MGKNIYMRPSDMNLKIRSGTVRHNNKILVSDGKFSLGKNFEVNVGPANSLALGPTDPTSGEEPVISKKFTNHKALAQQTPRTTRRGASASGVPPGPPAHELAKKPTPQSGVPLGPHKDEKIAFILFLAGGFTIWNIFR